MAMTFRDYEATYKGRIVRTDSKKDLEYLYLEEKLSTTEIEKVFDRRVSSKTISRRLIKFGIPRRDSKGENNFFWTGGLKMSKDGYVYIHSPNHPNSNSQGYMLEHRLVVENEIKRHLLKDEVVHHINKVRDDNRIENLQLLPSNSSHAKIEYKMRKRNELGMFI